MATVLILVPHASSSADPLPGGTFDPYVLVPGDTPGSGLAIAELTGDGIPDVAVAGGWLAGGRLRIFPGVGGGTFGAPEEHSLLNGASSVAAGDLNGDGKSDLAAAAQTQVEIFQQTASGTLTPGPVIVVEALKVKIADVTGDGRADLLVIGWSGQALTVYPQDPSGTLGLPVTYPVPLGGYNDLEVADIDGDGDTDIVAMSGQLYDVPNLTVLLQQSGGQLSVHSYQLSPITMTHGLGIGDVDGDGLSEVVVSHGGNRPDSSITVFEAASDGSLTQGATIAVADSPEPVEVSDVDLDGYDDVVVAHGGWELISVLYGSPGGINPSAETFPAPAASHYEPHGLSLSDIDQDGDSDVVLGHASLALFRNRLVRGDLNLALTASPRTAVVGSAVMQTATVLNEGTLPMSAQLRVSIPAHFKVQRWTDSRCRLIERTLECPVTELPPGARQKVTIVLRAYSSGSAVTSATVITTSGFDIDPADNEASLAITIRRGPWDERVRAAMDQLVRRGILM